MGYHKSGVYNLMVEINNKPEFQEEVSAGVKNEAEKEE